MNGWRTHRANQWRRIHDRARFTRKRPQRNACDGRQTRRDDAGLNARCYRRRSTRDRKDRESGWAVGMLLIDRILKKVTLLATKPANFWKMFARPAGVVARAIPGAVGARVRRGVPRSTAGRLLQIRARSIRRAIRSSTVPHPRLPRHVGASVYPASAATPRNCQERDIALLRPGRRRGIALCSSRAWATTWRRNARPVARTRSRDRVVPYYQPS